jgi:hypothetical protein
MENEPDQDIVEAVRQEYYRRMNLAAVSNRPNPRLDTAAVKAARVCEELKVDPAIFVAAQLMAFSPHPGHDRFFATDLCTGKARENVAAYLSMGSRGCTWEGSWLQQKKYLSMALNNTNRTIEEVLLDHNIGFSAWFRCLISKAPFPSVVKRYGYPAWQELQSRELRVFLEWLERNEGVRFDLKRIPEYW